MARNPARRATSRGEVSADRSRRAPAAQPEDFLLEIGCEELPADYLPGAMQGLAALTNERFAASEGFSWRPPVEVYATSRRFALLMREMTPTVCWEKVGPSKTAAYDTQGQPTPAAQGFARSQGVPLSALQVKETPKGLCVVAAHAAPVVPTLAEAIPALVNTLRFPKQMRWRSSDPTTFARPIRWLVALYGTRVVPCVVAGVTSGRRSSSLRRDATAWLTIPSAGEYLRVMKRHKIQLERRTQHGAEEWFRRGARASVLESDTKQANLDKALRAAALNAQGCLVERGDEAFSELLTTATFLAEHPVVAIGAFRRDYLTLPPEVLATAMVKHLKAFSVHDAQGRLLPKFLVVLEGRPTRPETVMANYERILEARFADAEFFWRADTKTPLAAKVPQLAGVTFHQRLGTMGEKVERMITVAAAVVPPAPPGRRCRARLTAPPGSRRLTSSRRWSKSSRRFRG